MIPKDPDNAAFAASLRRLRTGREWTQAYLGRLAGVREETVANVESGMHGTTLRTAGALAKALGMTLAEMLAPQHAGAVRRG